MKEPPAEEQDGVCGLPRQGGRWRRVVGVGLILLVAAIIAVLVVEQGL
jgi:hypothetical protein